MAKSARIFLFTVAVATSYRHYRHGIEIPGKRHDHDFNIVSQCGDDYSVYAHVDEHTTITHDSWTQHGTLFGTAGSKTGGGGGELLPAMRKPTACISVQGL